MGYLAFCMRYISPSVVREVKVLKNNSVWDDYKKKSPWCLFLFIQRCVSELRRALEISSRWVAGNGSEEKDFLGAEMGFPSHIVSGEKACFLN